MSQLLQVSITAGSEAEAQKITRTVVEQRLAACAQVLGPMQSSYWWEGKLESSTEWLCIIKTNEAKFAQLDQTIRELHSYEMPEIIASEIVAGSEKYLGWLHSELEQE